MLRLFLLLLLLLLAGLSVTALITRDPRYLDGARWLLKITLTFALIFFALLFLERFAFLPAALL
ncbi:MAG: hypothetical protein LBG69_09155 [Zoogloeaceae bacterium]|jgi:hypothetical protein|nr:hypothetical protein [Zoogloeaceae bacterium]